MFWDDLKKEMTKNYQPNQLGYKKQVVDATQIFVLARPYLKNQHAEVDNFNQDSEIAECISVCDILKDII